MTPGDHLTEAEMAEASAILLPQGARGPAFLALPNHYAIRRYNNSAAYALAVGLMADGVMGKPGLIRAWPNDAALSRDQRLGAQRQITNGETPDGYLSAALADRLIALAGAPG